MSIRFGDRVVTGVGAGRAFALELARHGTKVVVNDLGGARGGTAIRTPRLRSPPRSRRLAARRCLTAAASPNMIKWPASSLGRRKGGVHIVPAALYLVSEDAPGNAIVCAGTGVVQASYITLTQGKLLAGNELSPEGVAAHRATLTDRAGEIVPQSGAEQAAVIFRHLQGG